MTKTSTRAERADLSGLQPLAGRFKTWRATRQRGQRIPEELWQAATELARVHGLSGTAAVLKLSYYELKRRLLTERAQPRGHPSPPVFIEVPAVRLPPGGDERGTIELVRAGGARLILRFPTASPDDVLPVVQLFLRHRA